MAIHIRRREFITLLGSATAFPARAQQPHRMQRIGVLLAANADDSRVAASADPRWRATGRARAGTLAAAQFKFPPHEPGRNLSDTDHEDVMSLERFCEGQEKLMRLPYIWDGSYWTIKLMAALVPTALLALAMGVILARADVLSDCTGEMTAKTVDSCTQVIEAGQAD